MFGYVAILKNCYGMVLGPLLRHLVLAVIDYIFMAVPRHLGLGKILVLAVGIWFCLCWISVFVLGLCSPLWFIESAVVTIVGL